MPNPVYASNSDVAAYLTTESPIDNVDAVPLLRAASMLVRQATRRDRYEIELTTGLPKNADYAQAMVDATCAQVLAWHSLGVNPLVGAAGEKAERVSVSLGGASYSVGTVSVAAQDTKAELASGQVLSVLAAAHLRDVGLMSAGVAVGGSSRSHVVTSPLANSGTFPERVL